MPLQKIFFFVLCSQLRQIGSVQVIKEKPREEVGYQVQERDLQFCLRGYKGWCRGTIGVVSKYVLNKSTPYIGKIPIAGNTIVYLFKKGENGLYIVLTTMDNMVDSGGNIVTSAMDGTTDLTVLALNLDKK